MNQTPQRGPSWLTIFFWLAVFWPVGIFFLYRKTRSDRSATFNDGRTLFGIANFLIFIGVVFALNLVSSGFRTIMPTLLFLGGGIVLRHYANTMRKRAQRIRTYISIVVNTDETSLYAIAEILALPYQSVVDDLQMMIAAGYFGDAHIDFTQGRLITYRERSRDAGTGDEAASRTVECPGCGARKRVYAGQASSCNYCGTPLG